MTYRDDLDAAQARADALQHEVDKLERENAELREHEHAQPAPQPAKPPRSRRRWWLPVSFAAGVVGLALGIAAAVSSCVKPRITGAISATGPKLGTWTVQPTWCQSGQRNQFRGVQFFEDDGNTHGVGYHAPIGDSSFISVNEQAGDKSYQFSEKACRVLDGHIDKQQSSVNRITNLTGHVKFDCTDGDEHVTGDLTFENCH